MSYKSKQEQDCRQYRIVLIVKLKHVKLRPKQLKKPLKQKLAPSKKLKSRRRKRQKKRRDLKP